MTYRATRYYRSGKGQDKTCPDSSIYSPHGLIPDPDSPGLYVCPYAYDQERGEELTAQWEAEAAAERQAKAEQIADRELREYNVRNCMTLAKATGGFSIPRQVREMLIAAALAGMEATR